MLASASELAPGFYVAEGRCWRMVHDFAGRASHCREPTGWRGRYVNPKGMRWTVWACDRHLEELADVVAVGSPLPDVSHNPARRLTS